MQGKRQGHSVDEVGAAHTLGPSLGGMINFFQVNLLSMIFVMYTWYEEDSDIAYIAVPYSHTIVL